MKKKNIICICSEANDKNCEECLKYKKLSPKNTYAYNGWKKDISDIKE